MFSEIWEDTKSFKILSSFISHYQVTFTKLYFLLRVLWNVRECNNLLIKHMDLGFGYCLFLR